MLGAKIDKFMVSDEEKFLSEQLHQGVFPHQITHDLEAYGTVFDNSAGTASYK